MKKKNPTLVVYDNPLETWDGEPAFPEKCGMGGRKFPKTAAKAKRKNPSSPTKGKKPKRGDVMRAENPREWHRVSYYDTKSPAFKRSYGAVLQWKMIVPGRHKTSQGGYHFGAGAREDIRLVRARTAKKGWITQSVLLRADVWGTAEVMEYAHRRDKQHPAPVAVDLVSGEVITGERLGPKTAKVRTRKKKRGYAVKNPVKRGTYTLEEVREKFPEVWGDKRFQEGIAFARKSAFHSKEIMVTIGDREKGLGPVTVVHGTLREIQYDPDDDSEWGGYRMVHEAGDQGDGKKSAAPLIVWDMENKRYTFSGGKFYFDPRRGMRG